MSMSGAGMTSNKTRDPKRVYKRDLQPVGKDYTQALIPYKKGYWAQYGVGTALCVVGLSACVAFALFATTAFLAPLYLSWPIMVVCAGLPVWWIRTYVRQQRALTSEIGPS